MIVQQIFSVCGVDPKLEKIKLGQIFVFLNTELGKIKDNQDIHDWANSERRGYILSGDYREAQECVNKLIKDEIILGSIDEINGRNRHIYI